MLSISVLGQALSKSSVSDPHMGSHEHAVQLMQKCQQFEYIGPDFLLQRRLGMLNEMMTAE